ncbi:MAG: hypothetical protein Q8S32_06695, partial [Burkholderiaceae bacterium]|nr:hypothetical protein [Burkholderiaceae bacterium]
MNRIALLRALVNLRLPRAAFARGGVLSMEEDRFTRAFAMYLFTPPLSFISRTQNDSAGVKLMACAKAIALKHQLVGLTYPKPLKLV